LWEKVVFGLELHAAHHDQPEEIGLFVVSAGDDLVIDEVVLDLFVVPVLSFMISDQNKSRVKSAQQISQQEIWQVLVVVENDEVVY
jgi:hypothetical protein